MVSKKVNSLDRFIRRMAIKGTPIKELVLSDIRIGAEQEPAVSLIVKYKAECGTDNYIPGSIHAAHNTTTADCRYTCLLHNIEFKTNIQDVRLSDVILTVLHDYSKELAEGKLDEVAESIAVEVKKLGGNTYV